MNSLFADVTCGPKLPLFIVHRIIPASDLPSSRTWSWVSTIRSSWVSCLYCRSSRECWRWASLTGWESPHSLVSRTPLWFQTPYQASRFQHRIGARKILFMFLKIIFSYFFRVTQVSSNISTYFFLWKSPLFPSGSSPLFLASKIRKVFWAKVPHIDDDVDLFQALPFFWANEKKRPRRHHFAKLVLPKNRHTHTHIHMYIHWYIYIYMLFI